MSANPESAGLAGPQTDPLFWRATSVELLHQSWARVRANNGAAGGDGVSVARFGFFAEAALPALSERLRTFSYRPGPSRRVNVPKKSGGMRPLDIPCVVDRVAQGAAAAALTPVLEPLMEDSSFAYRPGRGVAQAVQRISSLRRDGYTFVVEADIKRYFENIRHDLLLGKLEAATGDDAILDLIALWLEWHAPAGIGLPQGSPLSPLLANLHLDAADEALEGRGVRLVRYADDFLLLAKTEARAERALKDALAVMAEHGLELDPDETRVVSFDRGFRFLGHLFVRSFAAREISQEVDEDAIVQAAEVADGDAPEKMAPLAGGLPSDSGLPPRAPGQRVLYLLEPGRRLTAANEAFCVMDDETAVLKLPNKRVDRIEIGPGCDADLAALDLAAASETEVVRINGHGETLGVWTGPRAERASARRHLAQAALILDPKRRLALALILTAGRVRNQRALLHRLNRDSKDVDTAAAAAELNGVIRRFPKLKSIQEAMGWEGRAGALVWPCIARALRQDFGFTGRRRRRPAGSAFDTVLNVLTHLLARDIRVAISRQGLHPGFAVLHASEDGEDALSYDLMEEFRAALVEATAVALVNRKALVPEMFELKSTGYTQMGRDGWRAVIRGYEAACARPVASPLRNGDRVSWRVLMQDQAAGFASHIEGRAEYRPVILDY